MYRLNVYFFVKMREFIETYQKLTNEKFIKEETSGENVSESVLKLNGFLKKAQDIFREKWSTFDSFYCFMGLSLLFASITAISLFIQKLEDKYFAIEPFFNELLRFYSLTLGCCACLVFFFDLEAKVLVWSVCLIVNFYTIFVLKTCVKIKYMVEASFLKAENLVYLLVLFVPFSNSYVIRENVSVRFLLVSLLTLDSYYYMRHYTKLGKAANFRRKLLELAAIFFLIRIAEVFFICREEVLVYGCKQSVFATQMNKLSFDLEASVQLFVVKYASFIVLNSFVVGAVVFYVKKHHKNVLSYVFASKIVLLFVYWNFQLAQHVLKSTQTGKDSDYARAWLKLSSLWLARSYYSSFLFEQSFIWLKFYSSAKRSISDAVLGKKTILVGDYEQNCNDLSVSLALFATLVSGESSASIWILILLLKLYAKFKSDYWKHGTVLKQQDSLNCFQY